MDESKSRALYNQEKRIYQNLIRDAGIILKNIKLLPQLAGSYTWLTYQRFKCPDIRFSELSIKDFALDLAEITLISLATIPFALYVPCAFFAAFLYHIAETSQPPKTPTHPLRIPLRWLIDFTRNFMKLSLFNIPKDETQHLVSLETTSSSLTPTPKWQYAGQGKSEFWIAVNGIVETRRMHQKTCELLSEMVGNRPINMLYNPSFGTVLDLIECLLGRSIDIASIPAIELYEIVKEQLGAGKKVVIVAHSQGGIIVSNTVKLLVEEIQNGNTQLAAQAGNLEVYTFGAGADEFPCVNPADKDGTVPYVEHFMNTGDFVAHLGPGYWLKMQNEHGDILGPNEKRIFVNESDLYQGHFMKEHYFPAMKNKLFKSQLEQPSRFITEYTKLA